MKRFVKFLILATLLLIVLVRGPMPTTAQAVWEVNAGLNQAIFFGQSVTLTANWTFSTEETGNPYTVEWTDLSAGTSLGTVSANYDQRPISQTFQPAGFTGIHLIELKVTDQFGNSGTDIIKVMVFSPVVANAPVVASFVDGPLGNNGWFTSPTSVAWAVFPDTASTSSCQTVIVDFDTQGTSIICEATAFDFTVSETVTVKVDQTGPLLTLLSPSPPPPGQPLAVNEGNSLPVEAAASDPISGIEIIEWDLDEDGHFESANPANFDAIDDVAGGSTPCFLVARATDLAGNVSQVTLEILINNVPPSLGLVSLSETTIPLGGSTTASANFTDPGILDTHTATINWNDGTLEQVPVSGGGGSGSVESSHAYNVSGQHQVTVTVTDKDGGVGASSAVVTVLTGVGTIDDVLIPGTNQMVAKGDLNAGQGNSLIVKLEGTKEKLLEGDVQVAVNKLNAYLNELNDIAGISSPCYIVGSNLKAALEVGGD